MNVKMKILGLSGILIGIAGILVTSSLLAGGNSREALHEVSTRDLPSTLLLLNIDRDAYQSILALEQAATTSADDVQGRKSLLSGFRENAQQTWDRWVEVKEHGEPLEGTAGLRSAYESDRAAWIGVAEDIARRVAAGESIPVADLQKSRALFDTMRDHIDVLEEKHYEPNVLGGVESSSRALDANATYQSVGIVVFVAVGVVLAFLLARKIVRPIEEISQVIQEMGHGNFDVEVHHRSQDEIGRAAEAVRKLQSALSAVAAQTELAASGDLTVQVEALGPNDSLGNSVRQLLEHLRNTMGQLARATDTLSRSAVSLESVGSSLEHDAQSTSQRAGAVSAASEEMQASIQEIAGNASEAARVAAEAVAATGSTNEAMLELQRSSTQIGEVTQLIASIAEQTNLLALNATIEAARAGELGKGFAVVAHEVKELAIETSKATSQISETIGTVQRQADGAVTAIQQVGHVIEQINTIASTIASAIEEQTATTSEITQNVTEVATSAQSTLGKTSQTTACANEVNTVASELQALVTQFKI